MSVHRRDFMPGTLTPGSGARQRSPVQSSEVSYPAVVQPRDLPRTTLDAEGPWELPVAGLEVLQVTFAYPIDIVAYGEGGLNVMIRFEGAFELAGPGGEIRKLDASKDSWEDLSVVLALRHDCLRRIWADDTATLLVEFASGRRIEAGPTPDYENWQVSGHDFMLISMPGGEVGVYGGDKP